jgi:DNA-binding transcriptional MerR regulator
VSHDDAVRDDPAAGTPAAEGGPCKGALARGAAREKACSMTTGDLAKACETTVRTVRFYEEAGVLCPEMRSEGGHRLFGDGELAKLQLVMDLREAGVSLNDIRSLFELKAKCATAEEASACMSKVLGRQIEEMQRKIATLRKLREELASTLAIIQECQSCESPEFPNDCKGCDVLDRDDLPRAMRLLWGRREE